MVLESVMVPDLKKITGTVDKKISAVGVTKVLCECKDVLSGSYSRFW